MQPVKLQTLFYILTIILTSQIITAQVKWGEIPKSDLEMKKYDKDTSASALILYDRGESYFNDDLDIVYNRHLRVKIFNSKAYQWGTHSVTLYSEKSTEAISKIEGATYSLDDSGNIKKNEFDDDEVYKEKVDETHTRYKFTLPQLKPGCVIEIKYTIKTKSFWFMRDWDFQYNEPVRWSEYNVRTPLQIHYVSVLLGYEPYAIEDWNETTQVFSGSAVNYLGVGGVSTPCKCRQMRWAVKDLPALKDEPFITTKDDYRNKVMLQIAGYSLSGTGVQRILNDWSKLVNDLSDNKKFGRRIEESSKLKDKALSITSGINNDFDKTKAIYNWLVKSIVWDGKHDLIAEQDAEDLLESAKGNNAEITFLFLSLLKCIGITGDPVILSTRNNGKLIDQYPLLTQFDYVLARVKTGSGYTFVDATSPLRPIELLPPKVLNTRGLVIKQDSVKWVKINSQNIYTNNSAAFINVNNDGSITGTLMDKLTDYDAYYRRMDIKEKKDIELAKEIFDTDASGINIDSVTITGKDSINIPLKFTGKISSLTYAQSNGELIYINPHIINRFRNNPFKSEDRKYAIDYAYKRKQTTVIMITLPKGYEVKEVISNKSFNAINGIFTFERKVLTDSSTVRINYSITINDVEIKPVFYKNVKQFYEQMIAAESDQLVLAPKKKVEPAPVSAPVTQKQEPAPVKKQEKGKKKK